MHRRRGQEEGGGVWGDWYGVKEMVLGGLDKQIIYVYMRRRRGMAGGAHKYRGKNRSVIFWGRFFGGFA